LQVAYSFNVFIRPAVFMVIDDCVLVKRCYIPSRVVYLDAGHIF